jgi:hypothetical protein
MSLRMAAEQEVTVVEVVEIEALMVDAMMTISVEEEEEVLVVAMVGAVNKTSPRKISISVIKKVTPFFGVGRDLITTIMMK